MRGAAATLAPLARLRSLLGAKWPLFLARVVLALVCFAVAIVLAFIPGPAILFWFAGFLLLGFSVGQVLMSVQRTQEFLNRHIPPLRLLPRLKKGHVRAVMKNRWVQWLDRVSSHRERRHAKRAARRARRGQRLSAPLPAGEDAKAGSRTPPVSGA